MIKDQSVIVASSTEYCAGRLRGDIAASSTEYCTGRLHSDIAKCWHAGDNNRLLNPDRLNSAFYGARHLPRRLLSPFAHSAPTWTVVCYSSVATTRTLATKPSLWWKYTPAPAQARRCYALDMTVSLLLTVPHRQHPRPVGVIADHQEASGDCLHDGSVPSR